MTAFPPRTNSSPTFASESSSHVQSQKDGTFYQSRAGNPAPRIYLFSPVDGNYANAVHRDAALVGYDEAEERIIRRKIDKVLIPLVLIRLGPAFLVHRFGLYPVIVAFLTASFTLNQFDRTNMCAGAFEIDDNDLTSEIWDAYAGHIMGFLRLQSGNAHAIDDFNENYGLTTNAKWTLALSIFYVGYCLLEIPANLLLRYIGANRFFFLSLSFWGSASISFAFGKGYGTVLLLRLLMGIGEAGFYAGMIYYLSFWYKRHELALRISLCMNGTLPGAFGGLLAYGLVRIKTRYLSGWQFLFFVEALPTLIMAILVLIFLPSFLFAADFLSMREKAIAQARLDRDQKPQSHGGMTGREGFNAIIRDPNAWLLTLIYAGFNVGVATISYFLPVLIKNMGFSAINAQGMTVAPYAVGWFVVVLLACHSDQAKDRGWHVIFSSILSGLGYIILATIAQCPIAVGYCAMFLVIGGLYSLFPLVMSWTANTLSPTSKRGVGTAFIVSLSNCVSVLSPQAYFDPEDDFKMGHAIAALCLFVAASAAFILRTRLAVINESRLKDAESAGIRDSMQRASEELWDTDPRYIFIT